MSNRKDGWGSRSFHVPANREDLTRKFAAAQPPGAEFTKLYEVRTWTCVCGLSNPIQKFKCKFCGEGRAEA